MSPPMTVDKDINRAVPSINPKTLARHLRRLGWRSPAPTPTPVRRPAPARSSQWRWAFHPRERQRRAGGGCALDRLRVALFGIIFLPNLYSKPWKLRKQEVVEAPAEASMEGKKRQRQLNEADELFGESRYQEAFDLLTGMNRPDDAQVLWRQARLLYNLAKRCGPDGKLPVATAIVSDTICSGHHTCSAHHGCISDEGQDEDWADGDNCSPVGTTAGVSSALTSSCVGSGVACSAGESGTAGAAAAAGEVQAVGPYQERGQLLSEGLRLVERALDADDSCAPAHKWCAVLLDAEAAAAAAGGFRARAQRLRTIHSHLRRAVDLDPRDPAALYMLGEWCETLSELTWVQRVAAALVLGADAGPACTLEDAARLLERAEAAAPRFYSANLLALGRVYMRLGKDDLAKHYLQQAAQYPERTDEDQEVRWQAKQLLGQMQARAQRVQGAIVVAQQQCRRTGDRGVASHVTATMEEVVAYAMESASGEHMDGGRGGRGGRGGGWLLDDRRLKDTPEQNQILDILVQGDTSSAPAEAEGMEEIQEMTKEQTEENNIPQRIEDSESSVEHESDKNAAEQNKETESPFNNGEGKEKREVSDEESNKSKPMTIDREKEDQKLLTTRRKIDN